MSGSSHGEKHGDRHDEEHDEELEPLVAAALEAFETEGEPGLARVLEGAGAVAERVRGLVQRVGRLGFLGDGYGAGLPRRIEHYEARREIGRGGMGIVYEALDLRTQTTVALKVVRSELLGSRAALVRFSREVAAVSRMVHPAIVPIVASGNAEGLPWYAMPMVEGADLERALARLAADGHAPDGPRLHRILGGSGTPPACFDGPWWQIGVRCMAQVAAGVAHAHAQDVVHRDLKPANVILTRAGKAMILDFGLARLRGGTRLTRSGHGPGSPAYMAPEQLRGEPADERTDVYGLAVTLWHFLGLRAPCGEGELPSLVRRVELGQWVPLPGHVAPRTLVAVLRRAGDVDRALRYESAAAFLGDLERVLAGGVPELARLPYGVRVRRAIARNRAVFGGILALLLGLPIVLALLLWREGALGAELRGAKDRTDAKVREFEQLAAVVRCSRLLARTGGLVPAWPGRRAALAEWLRDADELLAERDGLQQSVAALATRTAKDDSTAERFLHDELVGLVAHFDGELVPARREVARRLRFAEQVAEASVHHLGARYSWEQVRAAIADSPRYAGARIELLDDEVTGLVPLGPNPVSGLWEFYELASAWDGEVALEKLPLPRHREDGSIEIDATSGIVFVLLPGGVIGMGAQNADPTGPHFDPAVDVDAPFHRVKLGPFLIARHELTQAQWLRLASTGVAAANPSLFPAGSEQFGISITPSHPVENIGWAEARTLLLRHGMDLPTEAQWEYAARAGTTTPWFVPEAELPRAANLADATCLRVAGANFECEAWSDGHAVHAPVGSMLANRFGLFDVAGNVFEWCRDEFGDYRDPCEGPDGLRTAKGDGVGEPDPRRARAVRGGSCMQRALYARSAWRNGVGPELRLNDIGVRAVRRLGI